MPIIHTHYIIFYAFFQVLIVGFGRMEKYGSFCSKERFFRRNGCVFVLDCDIIFADKEEHLSQKEGKPNYDEQG